MTRPPFWFPLATAILVALFRMPAVAQEKPLDVVPDVDLERYQGTWYEIARLPNRFQEDCASNVTAQYELRPDGRIDVTNRCIEQDGEISMARGVARRVDDRPPSVLEVRFAPALLGFLPLVWGDYQIIALADDYSHALVGTPDREYLWILARKPALDGAVYERLTRLAAEQGFDTSRLVVTNHQP